MAVGSTKTYELRAGTYFLQDEADVSSFLRRDHAPFLAWSLGPPTPKDDIRTLVYNRAKRLNTEFMFSALKYDRPSRRKVLEIGVGNANLISRFADLGFDAYALDFYPWEMDQGLSLHVKQGGRAFTKVSAPMARLPFADRSFDIVYMHAALHHALPRKESDFRWSNSSNLHDSIREIGRVLKAPSNGGVLFVLGEGVYPEGITDRYHERNCQENGVVYESWYTMSEYDDAFRRAGVKPTLWVDQENLLVRASIWNASGERVEVASLSDGLGEDNYSELMSLISRRSGTKLAPIFPSWISVVGSERRQPGNAD